MTEESASGKLTLSKKSTLTLKNVNKPATSGGRKVVQVEVRKKRVPHTAQHTTAAAKPEIDKETAQKLKLLAEAKEYDAKRKQEEEAKEARRKEQLEQQQAAEKERLEAERKEAAAQKAREEAAAKKEKQEKEQAKPDTHPAEEHKVKKTKDYDDEDSDDDEEDSYRKKGKKSGAVTEKRPLTREETFEQERKKIQKRSIEVERRSNKLSMNSLSDDDDDDYGYAPRRRFKKKAKKPAQTQTPAASQEKVVKEVIIPETITVQELANRMAEKSTDVIKRLMSMGVMATINQSIDADTAQIIVEDMGHKVKRVSDSDVEAGLTGPEDKPEDLQPRAPIVTVMGHVDHGKTSLLDALRETNVAAKEAGGITQHIGAYQITVEGGHKITFIDTPGHEAFSEMRARGAQVTDIVVLVVAANDGIMPQTVEAIRHAQAANVPIVVAINKIDLPGADPMRVKTELLQYGIAVEEMGGESLCAEISAKKRINIDKLVDAILLQAEMLDLKANPNRPAQGTVIEAKMEKGRGSVATVLVQRGTLHVGDILIAGKEWGHVRAMFNEWGKKVQSAEPAAPVEVTGLQGTPMAGDTFVVVKDEAQAREVTGYRIRKEREAKAVAGTKSAMEQMMEKIKSGESKHLSVVIKADVQGSAEALEGSLKKLSNDEVSVQILHSAVGPISESDVTLAHASKGLIIGFNVRANAQARELAHRDGVDIRYYSIIYNVVDDVKKALEGMLTPELREKVLGYALVKTVFNITGVGKVAGCEVTEGLVRRGAKVRLLRDNVVIHDGNLGELKRYKDDVKEVKEGLECGISFENYSDIQANDTIECYEVEEIAKTL